MKLRFAVLAMATVGCGAHFFVSVGKRPLRPAPAPIRLINRSTSYDSAKRLTRVKYQWDLSNRQYQKIECEGVSSISGLEDLDIDSSKLEITFEQSKAGDADTRIYLDQNAGDLHSGSSTQHSSHFASTLSDIRVTPDAKLIGKKVTLLTWKNRDSKRDSSVVVTFR